MQVHPGPGNSPDELDKGGVAERRGSFSERMSGSFRRISHQLTVSLTGLKQNYLTFATLALYFGAGLSIVDLLCDLAMVREYILEGKQGYANATIATILTSLIGQMVVVAIQNSKMKKRVQLREMMFVVLLMKPGVDAYRVASGSKQRPGSKVTPHNEFIYIRAIELFTECIPGTVIQAMAIVGGQDSLVAVASLTSSIVTAALISASISVEKDVDKKCREDSPLFYGLLPLESKVKTVALCFLIMLLAMCQLASKAFACALCNVESSFILVAYLGADIAFAIIYKVARRDFMYWIPIDDVSVSFIMSFVERVAMKVVLDFTGMLQARHPYEYGGGYFSMTVLTTPIVCLYFGSRYLTYVEDEEVQGATFSSELVYGAIGGMAVLQIITLASILCLIPSNMRSTLTSFQTGSTFICDRFHATETDKEKMSIFGDNKVLWAPVVEEVRQWLNDGLLVWMEEEPDWFDEFTRSSVPDWLVDDEETLKKLRAAESE